MKYYCKECKYEFDIPDKECKGFWNWHCPKCGRISPRGDVGIIWKCSKGTV
jgi:hypothetical protein